MKRLILFTFCLLSIQVLSSFSLSLNKRSNDYLPKEMKDLKSLSYIPHGTLNGQQIEPFFMFSKEVSNLDYREFLYHLKSNGKTVELSACGIDNTLWSEIDENDNTLYSKKYSMMDEYPVVNISKEAATLYCEWLSEVWNNKQDKYTVEFRLPTKNEWEYAALGGKEPANRDYPWNGVYCRNKNGVFLAQHKAIGLSFGPATISSFYPNEFGLYNMSGNVAEMINNEEIVKGGSWNQTEDQIKIQSEMPLQKSPLVGFRPIMTLKEK